MRAFLLLPLVVLAAPPRSAPPDIAPFRIPRQGETMAPAEPTQIAMRSETVVITLDRDRARVEAEFHLENTADAAESLQVGFPGAAQPAHWRSDGSKVAVLEWGEDGILDFTASVDGVAVEPRHEVKPDQARKNGHRYWLCWDLSLPARGTCVVKVAYQVASKDANYVPPSRLQNRRISYVLITGKGWKDVIGSARIVVRPSAGLTVDHVDLAEPAPARRDASELEWRFADFEPDTDIVVGYHVYADAADAVARIAPLLQQDRENPELLLDHAENLEALEQWCAAALAFERLGHLEQKDGYPYRRPQVDYVPPLYRAAVCARKGGDLAYAQRLAEQAIAYMQTLLRALDGKVQFDLRRVLRNRKEALGQMIAELRQWQ